MTSASKSLYAYSKLTKVKLTPRAKLRVKEKLFSEIGTEEKNGTQPIWDFFRYLNTASLLIAPMVVLFIITVTSKASSLSVPGDFLYPVKRVTENSKILLAPSDKIRVNLQIKFAEERLVEFEKVNLKDSVTETLINTQSKPVPEEFRLSGKQDSQALVELEIQKTIQTLTITSNNLKNKGDQETQQVVDTTIEKLINVSNGHMSIPASSTPSPQSEVPSSSPEQSSQINSTNNPNPSPEVLGATTENGSSDSEIFTSVTSNVSKLEESDENSEPSESQNENLESSSATSSSTQPQSNSEGQSNTVIEKEAKHEENTPTSQVGLQNEPVQEKPASMEVTSPTDSVSPES